MRLEEIEQRAWHIEQHCGDGTQARSESAALKEDLQTAIAERALPVTREWCRKNANKVEEPVDDNDSFSAWFGDTEVCQVSLGSWRVYYGSVFFNVISVGQLLDLLSGLGVRK